MIRISREQMDKLDELHFYGRLRSFAAERCRNPKLNQWLAAQYPGHAAWSAVWPLVRSLSEHDCALVLMFLAACECEGITAGPVEALIAHLPQHEIGIKLFLSERAYFHFSDFEFKPPAGAEALAEE